jgi:phthalate 4,5-dioxygenase oxygenase subunit
VAEALDRQAPRLQVQLRDWGFRYAAIRRPIHDAQTHDYVRVTLFIAPFFCLIPPNNTYNLAQAIVPIDDKQTMFHFIAWHETGGIATEAWRAFCAARRGIELDETWTPIRSRENHYLQDRDAMRGGGFTGIKGIPTQDIAMWETMGPIAAGEREHLGSSDVAVVQFRRQMVAAARACGGGAPAIGTVRPRLLHTRLASFEGVVPKSTDWRTLGVSAEENAAA